MPLAREDAREESGGGGVPVYRPATVDETVLDEAIRTKEPRRSTRVGVWVALLDALGDPLMPAVRGEVRERAGPHDASMVVVDLVDSLSSAEAASAVRAHVSRSPTASRCGALGDTPRAPRAVVRVAA